MKILFTRVWSLKKPGKLLDGTNREQIYQLDPYIFQNLLMRLLHSFCGPLKSSIVLEVLKSFEN